MEEYIFEIILGLGVGTLGTLIGAGGGFILVPILILFFPDMDPATITAVSLAVVAVNASVGSIAYNHSKRIDFKTGVIFAIATIPGSILGVFTTNYIPKKQFDLIFGIILILLAIVLFLKKSKPQRMNVESEQRGLVKRKLTDSDGNTYEYSYNMYYGIIISILVGFFSPLLGIGGGIIHVPAMTEILQFPVHIATATSHFILAIMATVSVVVHYLQGDYSAKIVFMILMFLIGIIPGAILGARLSKKLKGGIIIKLLSLSLIVVGIRILLNSIS